MVLVPLVAVGLLAAACGGSGSSYGGKKAAPTTASTTTSSTPTTASGAASSATVQAVDSATLKGKVLVGPNGHTLYFFEKDTGTTSACTGGCAGAWPALTSSSAPSAGPGIDASKLSTATGQVANQVVFNGHLLYYFAADSAPGDVKGKGIPSWYPMGPDGNEVPGS
jgi:predicted lipoprotein with Yx(FWY)xxD motif